MPQMAPSKWLSLFSMFIIIFMLFNITNYYNFKPINPKMHTKTKNNNYILMNWKW
nr:ATP synthase F0 subunit 8 [Azana sp. WQY005]